MSVMYKNGSSWSNLMLQAYPVGAVYISYVSTSPSSLFGGTWTPITGRFPYFNAGTSTGGSNTHTLSVNEMPSHNHTLSYPFNSTWGGGQAAIALTVASGNNITTNNYIKYTGGNAAHNNMPAYQTFYAWRRTA